MPSHNQGTLSDRTQPAESLCSACHLPLFFFGTRDKYAYGSCPTCGTIELMPRPTQSEVEAAYIASHYAQDSHGQGEPEAVRRSSKNYYLSLTQVLRDYQVTGTVLDFGAGWGGLCEMLNANGFQCQGVELSERMLAECQRRGLPVKGEPFTVVASRLPDLSTVVMCGVFEHLIDPVQFLKEAASALRPGNLFITLQPTAAFATFFRNVMSLGGLHTELPSGMTLFDPPWHAGLFSLDGMVSLAGANGFELLEIRPAPQGRLPGWRGLAQWMLETLNTIGWKISGKHWPLIVAHTFIFRRKI